MNSSVFVNTCWNDEPTIFIGTVTGLEEIPNGEDLPVLDLQIENSFERYEVVMSQPHPELQLTGIPDSAVQLILWTARDQYAVSRSDTVILLETPESLLHLPESQLQCPDVAADIEQFIAQCPVQSLADFARRVLGRPSIGIPFMNLPSHGQNQYGEPGGLATHSLIVAQRTLATCAGFSDDERWVAAIAGLVHSIGQIHLAHSDPVDNLKLTLRTLGLISSDLRVLEKNFALGAGTIQHIIATMYQKFGRYQTHPLAMAVQTADRLADALRVQAAREKEFLLSAPAGSPSPCGDGAPC